MHARRKLLVLAAAGAFAPFASLAQRSARVIRIGFLGGATASGYASRVDALRAGLRELGYVEGKNIAIGSTYFIIELCEKRLELLKEALPRATRIAVLLNPGSPVIMLPIFQAMESVARTLRLTPDAVLVLDDGVMVANAGAIASLANKARLPSFGFTELAEAGGLMSYNVDNLVMWRRAAVFVDKILKGARPGDLPIERGSKFDMLINLKTARALGVTIPQSLLQRADRVIE